MADRGRGRGRGGAGGDRGGRGRGGDRGGGGNFRGGPRGGGFQGGRGDPPKVFGNGNPSPPDPQVTKLEDAMVKGDMVSMMAATSIENKAIPLPKRPGYGTKGIPIVLYTNYFELMGINPKTTLYRYSVGFQPNDRLPKPKMKRLIQLLLKMDPFVGKPIASDWAQTLVTTKKIDLEKGRFSTKLEWYHADGELLPTQTPNELARITAARGRNTFTILVQDIGTVELDEVLRDLAQPSTTYPLKGEAIQALNIIMSSGPGSDTTMAVASGNKFYPFGNHAQVQMADLGGALQALRGYYSSVRTSVSRILVNVNVATAAFYKPGPLLALMREFTSGRNPVNEPEQRKLGAFFRKLRFETNYIPELDKGGKVKKDPKGRPITKRKVHTIIDFSKLGQNAQTVRFNELDANGTMKQVTVADYFKRKYNITLTSPAAPLVNYGTTQDPKWIPAELCTVLPGQIAKRLLLGSQTSEMIRFAARRPHENAESITGDGLKVTRIFPVAQGLNAAMSQFGIKIDPSLLTVPGRILAAPQLMYREKTHNPHNGAWNLDPRQLGSRPFRRVKNQLKEWTTLIIHLNNRDTIYGGRQGAMHHLHLFRQTLESYGLGPGPVQPPIEMNISNADLVSKDVDRIQAQILEALKQRPQKPKFLFILLPSDSPVLYDSLKHLLDCQLGVPNICNVGSKFSKERGQMQYFANVAMKFNQKLGGVNHTVDVKNMAPLDAQTIVFGIDVTHPSPGSSEEAPSIAGVVASVDAEFSQFPASMRTQAGRQEMVAALDQMIVERLKLWSKRNKGGLPNKVIVYRDGVSESQYQIVLRDEYPAFEKAFITVYGKAKQHPKISIIMVGKRHHTRFYPTKTEDTDGKTGNPKPGTVVDRGVTGEKLFDFFLLAHQGLQGTAKPAHYVVLKDDNKLGADQLQTLTHNLCYTFARATRSVSICPPAYYADLVCERGRSYLQSVLKGDGSVQFSASSWQRDVHENLVETMYYL